MAAHSAKAKDYPQRHHRATGFLRPRRYTGRVEHEEDEVKTSLRESRGGKSTLRKIEAALRKGWRPGLGRVGDWSRRRQSAGGAR